MSGASDAARAAAVIVLLTPGLSVIIDATKECCKTFQGMNSYAIHHIPVTLWPADDDVAGALRRRAPHHLPHPHPLLEDIDKVVRVFREDLGEVVGGFDGRSGCVGFGPLQLTEAAASKIAVPRPTLVTSSSRASAGPMSPSRSRTASPGSRSHGPSIRPDQDVDGLL